MGLSNLNIDRKRRKRYKFMYDRFRALNKFIDYNDFEKQPRVKQVISMLDHLVGTGVVNVSILFYVQFLCFCFVGNDYVTMFVKNLCYNFTVKTNKLFRNYITTGTVVDPSQYRKMCHTLSIYLQKWYDFQDDICDMLSFLAVYSAEKIWTKYMILALDDEKNKSEFENHAQSVQIFIETLLNKMCLDDCKKKTLKIVQRSFKRFEDSRNFVLSILSQRNLNTNDTDFNADMLFVEGLLRQIEDIENGKIRSQEEISAVRRVLSCI